MATDVDMMASRLDAIKEVNKRVRVSFFLVVAAATIMLSAVWNTSVAWNQFAPRHNQLNTKDWDKEIDNDVEKERRKLLLNNDYLTIPLLGIRVAVSDLPLIGSMALLVLCFYYCSCTRLANQEISSLLSESKDQKPGVKRFIYFTIRSSMVLNNPALNDTPITRLEVRENESAAPGQIPKGFRAMTYLPVATVIVAIVADVTAMLLRNYRVHYTGPAMWMVVGTPARVQFIATDILAALIGMAVWWFSRAAIRYNDASVRLMLEFDADLQQ